MTTADSLRTYTRYVTLVVMSGVILWFGRPFLIPLAYALLVAFVMYPFCKFLERKGIPRTLSIAIPLLLLFILFGGLIFLLGYELVQLAGEWPLLHAQFNQFLEQLHLQLEQLFGWTTEEQNAWLRGHIQNFSNQTGSIIQESVSGLAEGLVNLVIIPIYVALILAFRRRLIDFLRAIVPEAMRDNLPRALEDTVRIFSRFIRGMVLVYLVVGILNTIGLWLIGVPDPLVYGMLTAVMTIIPYFGIVVSGLLPITVSWIHTGSIVQPLGIIGVFTIVQYLEANLIFPYVVGRHVHLNTFASITVIFLGALLWGVSGMILFLPFLAVLRIFTSHFPEWKAFNDVTGR